MAKHSPIFTTGRRVQASVTGTWKPLHESLCLPFWAFAPLQYLFLELGRFFLNDFKPLYNFYVKDRFVSLLTTLGVKCN